MSLHRYAAKRDENEPQVVRVLEACGWKVEKLSGKGVPDLLCGWHRKMMLVEVKMPGEKLNDVQEKWHAAWPGEVQIVHDVHEALAVAEWGKE